MPSAIPVVVTGKVTVCPATPATIVPFCAPTVIVLDAGVTVSVNSFDVVPSKVIVWLWVPSGVMLVLVTKNVPLPALIVMKGEPVTFGVIESEVTVICAVGDTGCGNREGTRLPCHLCFHRAALCADRYGFRS